jgi:hypothetical protein
MATDRDEQQREQDEQQRQQQELDEIRRSFADMGARMGSMFEPAEEGDQPQRPRQAALPAPPAAAPAPSVVAVRPRWWWVGLVLLFLAGTAFGWILPRGDGAADPTATPTTAARSQAPAPRPQPQPQARAEPRTSVPQSCLDTAEKADEVISRLNRNERDNRLAAELRDYTIASQACRREASR